MDGALTGGDPVAAAGAALAAGDPRLAGLLLVPALGQPVLPPAVRLMLARIAQERGDPHAALGELELAAQAGARPGRVHLLRLRALHALGRSAELLPTLRALLDDLPDDAPLPELEGALPAVHQAFQAGHAEAVAFYRLAVAAGCDDYAARLRIAEALEREGHLEEAEAALAALQPRLEAWGRACAARLAARRGRLEEAATALEEAFRATGEPAFFEQFLDHVVARGGAPGRLERFFGLLGQARLPPARLRLLAFRAALVRRALPEAMERLEEALRAGASPQKWDLVRLGWLAVDAGDAAAREAASALLGARLPGDPDALEVRTTLRLVCRDWTGTAELLATWEAGAAPAQQARIAFKRFELACLSGELEQAAALLPALGPWSELPPDSVAGVWRFLAETGAWDALLDDALPRLRGVFPFARFGELTVRAARATGRRKELLDHVMLVPAWAAVPDLVRIVATIGFEHLLALRPGAAQEAEALLADLRGIAGPAELARLDACRRLLAPPPARRAAGRREATVFLCTNPRYLAGTAVALASLLRHNPEAAARAELLVAADGACLELARPLLEPLAERAGARLVLLDAATLAPPAGLRRGYGLFTGGHALSAEAYWRIYVARWLAGRRGPRRAIYLDSDVLVGPAFLPLLERSPPPDALLLARPEVPRAEVAEAASRHGLPEGSYFNSGVLLLDLGAAATRIRLERAVVLAEREPERLVFHDQCALNLAFAGAAAPLEEAFNRFAPSGVEEAALRACLAETGVLHFLDRPKPWDPLHDGAASRLWYEQWQLVAAELPPALARRVLAGALC